MSGRHEREMKGMRHSSAQSMRPFLDIYITQVCPFNDSPVRLHISNRHLHLLIPGSEVHDRQCRGIYQAGAAAQAGVATGPPGKLKTGLEWWGAPPEGCGGEIGPEPGKPADGTGRPPVGAGTPPGGETPVGAGKPPVGNGGAKEKALFATGTAATSLLETAESAPEEPKAGTLPLWPPNGEAPPVATGPAGAPPHPRCSCTRLAREEVKGAVTAATAASRANTGPAEIRGRRGALGPQHWGVDKHG